MPLYEIKAKTPTQLIQLTGAPVLKAGETIEVELKEPTAEMQRCKQIGMIKFREVKVTKSTARKKQPAKKEEEKPIAEEVQVEEEVVEEKEEKKPKRGGRKKK